MNIDNGEPESNKVSNENHENDVNFAMKHTRRLLTVVGVWSYLASKPTRIGRHASKILIPLTVILVLVLLIPLISNIIKRDIPRSQLVIYLAPIIFRACNLLKYLILMTRRDSIRTCMRHMEADWRSLENEKDRHTMLRNSRIGHCLVLIFMTSAYSSAVLYYMLMPMLKAKALDAFNNGTRRPMVFPGADIYIDLEADYKFAIVYCTNCIAAVFLFTIVTSIGSIAVVLVSHACGQIEIVVSRLESIVDSDRQDNDRFVDERIEFILLCHVRVLRFASSIDDILREMCFVDIVGSTVVICLLEYYCLMEWDNSSAFSLITFIMLLLSWSFNIFIFCHIGELLKEQCLQVGRAAYMSDWYRLPVRASPAMVLIIAMSNYPRQLTAGGMMELSYLSFGTIMKTTLMYLGMVRSMAE